MSASALTHAYVHGLHVASELPLPELTPYVPAPAALAPDVRVRCRSVVAAADDPPEGWFVVRADGTVIVRSAGVATYAVRGGSIIDVDVAPGADPAEVRVYLLGSALGLLLHQRGEVPLHVSAVVIAGRAWAFTAPSGTGKSTLAAALHLHAGLPLVTDDVAVVRPAPDQRDAGEGGVWLWPGPPLIKLRADAHADVADVAPATLPEYATSTKVRLRIAQGELDAPVPLAGVVLLQRSRDKVAAQSADGGDVLRVRKIVGAPAFLAAQGAVYRLPHGVAATSLAAVFDRVAWLAASVPFFIGTLSSSEHPASRMRALAVAGVLRDLAAQHARTSPFENGVHEGSGSLMRKAER